MENLIIKDETFISEQERFWEKDGRWKLLLKNIKEKLKLEKFPNEEKLSNLCKETKFSYTKQIIILLDCVLAIDNEFLKNLINTFRHELDPSSFAKDKYALLFGIQTSKHRSLLKPVADIIILGNILKDMGYIVFAFRDSTYKLMTKYIEYFLKNFVNTGSHVVFFFAGHGFMDTYNHNYLMASDSKNIKNSLCAEEILQKILERKPGHCWMFLDVCRLIYENSKHVNKIEIIASNFSRCYSTVPYNNSSEIDQFLAGILVDCLRRSIHLDLTFSELMGTLKSVMEAFQIPIADGNMQACLNAPIIPSEKKNYETAQENHKNLLKNLDIPYEKQFTINNFTCYVKASLQEKIVCNSLSVDFKLTGRTFQDVNIECCCEYSVLNYHNSSHKTYDFVKLEDVPEQLCFTIVDLKMPSTLQVIVETPGFLYRQFKPLRSLRRWLKSKIEPIPDQHLPQE